MEEFMSSVLDMLNLKCYTIALCHDLQAVSYV